VLVPAVVTSELEARFLSDPELVQRVRKAMDHPETLVRHPAAKAAGETLAEPKPRRRVAKR
jgi:hypothetical protein